MFLAMAIQQFSESLPIMLYRTLDAIMPRFRRIFSDFNLTEQQWRVLRVLWENDEIAIKDLSALTLIPAPSLVGIVDRLQNNKLVVRRRSRQDRRSVFVAATRQARDLEQQIMPLVQATYLELKQSVEPKVWQDMMRGLRAVSHIDSLAVAEIEPMAKPTHQRQVDISPVPPPSTQQNDL
jgi:homoprotocatechuate degradation regulator HpaR